MKWPGARSGVPTGNCASLFFFSSRRRHTRFDCDWSSDVCSSDLATPAPPPHADRRPRPQHDRRRPVGELHIHIPGHPVTPPTRIEPEQVPQPPARRPVRTQVVLIPPPEKLLPVAAVHRQILHSPDDRHRSIPAPEIERALSPAPLAHLGSEVTPHPQHHPRRAQDDANRKPRPAHPVAQPPNDFPADAAHPTTPATAASRPHSGHLFNIIPPPAGVARKSYPHEGQHPLRVR